MTKNFLIALLCLLSFGSLSACAASNATSKPSASSSSTRNDVSKFSMSQTDDLEKFQFDESPLQASRLFLVSDIHGRFDSLKKSLAVVKFDKSDQLFVLGDSIDHGPYGFQTLLYLTQTLPQEGYHITVLTGDHEEMWSQMASQGQTDAQQLQFLKDYIASYGNNIPNGWQDSLTDWEKLTADQRKFLLTEMKKGFDEPHQLVVNYQGKWLSLSHSADFSLAYDQQSDWDLSWNNRHMMDAPATFKNSIAAKLGVSSDDVQVYIGHISGILFGIHPNFTDLDDTKVRVTAAEFDAVPVKIFEVNDQKFYD